MTDKQREIMELTDRLTEIINTYAAFDTLLPDLDAWSAEDLAEIHSIIDSELQRRFIERVNRVTH